MVSLDIFGLEVQCLTLTKRCWELRLYLCVLKNMLGG